MRQSKATEQNPRQPSRDFFKKSLQGQGDCDSWQPWVMESVLHKMQIWISYSKQKSKSQMAVFNS